MASTKQAVTVRTAQASEQGVVQALWKSVGLEPPSRSEWGALFEGGTSKVLVAQEDGLVVGAAIASFDGWRAYIYHVAVDEPQRKHGVGHVLIEGAEHHLAKAGARVVFVMVNEENTEGLALVGSQGYLPDGEIVLTKELVPA